MHHKLTQKSISDDVWSFSQILSQLIVEIENERSHKPTKNTDFMPLKGSE